MSMNNVLQELPTQAILDQTTRTRAVAKSAHMGPMENQNRTLTMIMIMVRGFLINMIG